MPDIRDEMLGQGVSPYPANQPPAKEEPMDAPLYCRKCESRSVVVSESQQMKMTHGKKRLYADVRCRDCGWRWWSRNSRALEQSRVLDSELAPPARLEET